LTVVDSDTSKEDSNTYQFNIYIKAILKALRNFIRYSIFIRRINLYFYYEKQYYGVPVTSLKCLADFINFINWISSSNKKLSIPLRKAIASVLQILLQRKGASISLQKHDDFENGFELAFSVFGALSFGVEVTS